MLAAVADCYSEHGMVWHGWPRDMGKAKAAGSGQAKKSKKNVKDSSQISDQVG